MSMVIFTVRCWRDDDSEAFLPDADDLASALAGDMEDWGCEWDVTVEHENER